MATTTPRLLHLKNCHQEGGISAVGGTGSIYTFYGPEEPLFKNLTENFLKKAGLTPLNEGKLGKCLGSTIRKGKRWDM